MCFLFCELGGWHEKMMHVRATGETLWNICEAKHLFVRTTTLQTWLTLHRLLWKGATSTEMERYPRRYWNFVHYAQFLKSRIVFFPATYLGWYWCIWYLYLRSFNSYRRYIPSSGADGDLDGPCRSTIEIVQYLYIEDFQTWQGCQKHMNLKLVLADANLSSIF